MKVTLRCLLLWGMLMLCLGMSSATEIKWTPNEDAENAPLPLSSKQRQQLVQLEQAIMSAPDPQKTLQEVAESNKMSPQELVNMMSKNSRDLAQDPSLAQPATITKAIIKICGTIAVALSQGFKKHPKMSGLTVACILTILFGMFSAPRNGIAISTGRSLISHGPTTIFSPPTKYLSKLANSDKVKKGKCSIQLKTVQYDDLDPEDDGVIVHKLRKHKELSQAVSTQISIDASSLLDDFDLDEDFEDEMIDLLFESAGIALESRQLTDFVPKTKMANLKFVSSSDDKKKHGALLVPGLGDWGFNGIVFLQMSKYVETDSDLSLTLTTVKGGNLFDGQIHLSVTKEEDRIVIRTHLVVPRRGKRLSSRTAQALVESLADSFATSTQKRSQQILTRRSQSSRFKDMAKSKAAERRRIRFVKEKEIEDMAVDRRRRRQRTNPDAGRYRPSGIRQQSPNNC